MVDFNGVLDISWVQDRMIKDFNGRFDDYFISPKIRQILLHWSYELVESRLW